MLQSVGQNPWNLPLRVTLLAKYSILIEAADTFSRTGLVRAPLVPTFIQTVAKNLVLWTIVRPFPAIALSPAYTILLLAWSTGEIIRYGYFTLMLSGFTSRAMVWLRYSAFVLIYPTGIGAEMWLVWRAIEGSEGGLVRKTMYGELALYVPGE